MPLVLGATVGDVFDIGDVWIAVLSIDGPATATLVGAEGDKLKVSKHYKSEILPGKWVQLGPDPAHKRLRLNFTAPRAVAIKRRRAKIQ